MEGIYNERKLFWRKTAKTAEINMKLDLAFDKVKPKDWYWS